MNPAWIRDRATSWQRGGESHASWRARVTKQWESHVGPLPQYVITRGRRVPFASMDVLKKLASELDGLDEMLGVEVHKQRVTVEDGSVMWRTTPTHRLTAAEARQIAEGLRPNTSYSLYYRMEKVEEALSKPGEGAIRGMDRGRFVDDYWSLSGIRLNGLPINNRMGRALSAGAIEWVDYEAWARAPGYVMGYYFALIPRGDPARQWLAMRDGETNCVIERVREALRSKTKGLVLTPAREKVLKELEREFEGTGCGEAGLQKIASALKIKLVMRDVDGEVLWRPTDRTGKPTYEKQPEVSVYRQNGHAYAGEPVMPSIVRSAGYDVPSSVKDAEGLRACQLAFLAGKAGRAWTVGAEIVTEDGTVYRPPGMEEALNAAMGEHGEAVDLFAEPITRLGGVRSYRFGKWLELNRIGHLTPKWRDIWRDSVVEARVWNSQDRVPNTGLLDISAAYLGCGEGAAENALARVYARRHGFPGAIYRLYAVGDLDEVRAMAGVVHITRWELEPRVHPAAVRSLVGHLELHEWLPIPLALYLVDTGLARLSVDRAAVSMDRLETLHFPGRDLAVEMIGSCMRNKRKTSIITRDEAESDFYVDKFLRDGRAPVARQSAGMYQVEYDSGEHKDRSHIRSYVLAYMQIAVIDALRLFGPDEVAYCCVDGIRVRAGVKAPAGLPLATPRPHGKLVEWTWGCESEESPRCEVIGERPAPGLWRWKEEGPEYNYHESHAQPPHAMRGAHAGWAEEGIPLPSDQIARAQVTFLDGQGGSGKSYRALRAFPGRRVVILCHNNEYALEVAKDAEKNPYGYPTRTYHEFFHLGNKPHTEWTEQKMGRERPDVVFWDEVGLVNVGLLERVLPWLRRVRAQVVLAGDPSGQLPNFEEEAAAAGAGERLLAWLRENCDQTLTCEEDFRAREPQLIELKRTMWRASPWEQYCHYQSAGFTTMSLEEAVAAWSPADTFVASTTRTRNAIGAMVAARPGQAPMRRLRFAPVSEVRALYRKRSGKLPTVIHPGTGLPVPAAVGSVIEVVGEPVVAIDGALWAPASASTVHGLQGRTVKSPSRLFVIEDGLTADWCPNIVYTIVSRVEYRSQIVRVVAPHED